MQGCLGRCPRLRLPRDIGLQDEIRGGDLAARLVDPVGVAVYEHEERFAPGLSRSDTPPNLRM